MLKDDGLVYAETPFLQQVHGGPYDFTRFTHLGHRRLFRKFIELESGATAGAGAGTGAGAATTRAGAGGGAATVGLASQYTGSGLA